jgi:hypothetical protein
MQCTDRHFVIGYRCRAYAATGFSLDDGRFDKRTTYIDTYKMHTDFPCPISVRNLTKKIK